MGWIAGFLTEQENAMTAAAVIEDRLSYLKQRNGLIDLICPLTTHSHRKFMMYVVNEIRTVASIIAPGSALPVTRSGSFKRIIAEMFKMGLEYEFDEETQWDLKEAIELAAARNLTVNDMLDQDGNVVTSGTNDDLAQMLFGTYAKMTQAFIDKINAMAFQGLQFGEVTATDTRTKTGWTLDFKEGGVSYNHFPAALTGTARWDQYTTANAISHLFTATRAYVATNGFKPDHTILSDELYQDIMLQDSTKNAASSMTVTQVGSVSPEMLFELMRRRGIPPLVPEANSPGSAPNTFDEMYEEEQTDKSVVRKRFHNANRFTFYKRGMGKRCFGPVLEGTGIEGLENMDMYPRTASTNVYIVAREKEKFPSLDTISGVASGIVLFPRPKLFYSQQVKDAS